MLQPADRPRKHVECSESGYRIRKSGPQGKSDVILLVSLDLTCETAEGVL
mgnify:FL=1